MEILHATIDVSEQITKHKLGGLKVGMVPTMGFLHSGHLSLIEACKKECDVCVVSVYVNPSQFNDRDDFESYPKSLDKDLELLKAKGCDLVWVPYEMQIEQIPLDLIYELNGYDKGLEGEFRSGHFKGVIEVVYRLFKAVAPHIAYFGEKDFQQFKVIETMVKKQQFKCRCCCQTYGARGRWLSYE